MKPKIVHLGMSIFNQLPWLRKPASLFLAAVFKLGGKRSGTWKTEYRQLQIQLGRASEYQRWMDANSLSLNALYEQKHRAVKFKHQPLISIIVPTYNTNEQHLRECIDSVLMQTYANWELCLADDTSPNQAIRDIILGYAQADDRIKYVFRKRNGHICKASNSAIKIATGEYVALLDHDDILWPNALFEIVKLINYQPKADLIYTDEDKLDEDGTTHSEPFFKPDWSPDYLRTINYITHFTTMRKSLVDMVGGFRVGTQGAQDWDLILRVTNHTRNIFHIPKIVYSWRKSATSTAQSASAKDYAYINQEDVLDTDLANRGYAGKAVPTQYLGYWRVKYAISGQPLVSIIIPTKDQYQYIKDCLDSIRQFSTYQNIEIIVVDTGSNDQRVWQLYDRLKKQAKRLKIKKWRKPFNFSAACNFGAKTAAGEYLLFLNNDTKVITPQWIENLLEHAQRQEVGAVGCKLLYADDTIQHAGIVVGMGDQRDLPAIAGHIFVSWDNNSTDHLKALYTDATRNYSAVTAACLMIAKSKFENVSGFDERLRIAYNDVDFCLKLRAKGLFNTYTPHAMLYHFESVSVGRLRTRQRDTKELEKEAQLMIEKWGQTAFDDDPYYNNNLDLKRPFANIQVDTTE